MKISLFKISVFAASLLLAFSCSTPTKSVFTETAAKIDTAAFSQTINGKQVSIYTLTGVNGIGVKVTNYGARIVSVCVPNANGNAVDVVLGYNNLSDYLNLPECYFGAAIGRYGNRIANAKFTLDSIEYQLTKNEGDKQLHGGIIGFNDVVWDAEQVDQSKIVFTYLAKDGEEGYPGNLSVTMSYELTNNNAIKIDYSATTDKPTVCNLTHHSYFNLSGEGAATIIDHMLMIKASNITPVDSLLIPTGEIIPVAGTPFDFTQKTEIAAHISANDQQIKYGFGYDHNWVLDRTTDEVELVASIYSPVTKIQMDVLTDQPGLQFYAGNFLDGKLIGKSGKPYAKRSGFCLETQHFPDSPNQANFPSVVLRPGENYKHICIYKFAIIAK